ILDNKSKRLKNLIEDLFEASKASSGNIDLNIEKLDLNQLLRQSIGENEEKLIESNLSLKLNIPKEPVHINCDGRRMYRVFENLLVNISKYSHENTRVYVDMVVNENQVFVSMKNISAYELNFEASEILERFKRGDLARNTEGSGLGLAIARDLVQLQGGKLGVQIDGDLFKVELSFNTI
ncbi:MAG: sensor histidine kinase, partial [Paraclostridium bifermentans]